MPCGNSRRSCNARCFHPGGPDCRSRQLSVPLRAALVPPYLIYLTGATIEHVANDETTEPPSAR